MFTFQIWDHRPWTHGMVLATLAPSPLPTTVPSTKIVALSHTPVGWVSSSFKELYKENPIFA